MGIGMRTNIETRSVDVSSFLWMDHQCVDVCSVWREEFRACCNCNAGVHGDEGSVRSDWYVHY
jgi:hypothetical protein